MFLDSFQQILVQFLRNVRQIVILNNCLLYLLRLFFCQIFSEVRPFCKVNLSYFSVNDIHPNRRDASCVACFEHNPCFEGLFWETDNNLILLRQKACIKIYKRNEFSLEIQVIVLILPSPFQQLFKISTFASYSCFGQLIQNVSLLKHASALIFT